MDASREEVIRGYHRACSTLGGTLAHASDEDLRRRSTGTRWTNEELLFHMVFGYMVVLALLPLVRTFGRLPPSVGKTMAFPTRWDPFFTQSMTLADVYAYPTLHFDFHTKQLSLSPH
jgi:hypothetical protein